MQTKNNNSRGELKGILNVALKGFGFVSVLKDKKEDDIFILKENLNGAVDGDTVKIRKGKKNKFEVVSIVSHNTKPLDIKQIIKKYNLCEEFPDIVIAEAKKAAHFPTDEEPTIKSRLDLSKSKTIVTIDPADARDLDDAVSLDENTDGTVTLGVHIADVSHYVKTDTELDKEAFKRATSVYFPDRVLPMLPPALSNGICSLNPNERRLTLSVFIVLDKFYNIVKTDIKKTIICTDTRFSYEEVQDILDGKTKHKHSNMLSKMAEICEKFEKERFQRGEIAFNVPEPKIALDKDGKIESVFAQVHTLSHRIIETFMILANEVVAETFNKLNLPFIYRIHEKPDPLKVAKFIGSLKPFAISHNLLPESATGQKYQSMLDGIKDENLKVIIGSLALRSMQKAKYNNENIGHFGLGAQFYCHFTSPIRRYPDLVIHRIIKTFFDNQLSSHKLELFKDFVITASEQSSKREIDAMEAEREVENMKRAEFMSGHIGETFNGVVNGITDFGIFVYLPENTAEGLLRIENIKNDKYKFNEEMQILIGKKGKIKMGDKIQVLVAGVNLRRAQIEFTTN
ncbi:MAG: VacB/RNase II family 3'-5' exoribonuclease [Christensenellaceae bacterium]|jgi:ribonuclease R|nr:VacB/RNase II family 3'-5' exoribonuclease [Christensenellaceae bacterium]